MNRTHSARTTNMRKRLDGRAAIGAAPGSTFKPFSSWAGATFIRFTRLGGAEGTERVRDHVVIAMRRPPAEGGKRPCHVERKILGRGQELLRVQRPQVAG